MDVIVYEQDEEYMFERKMTCALRKKNESSYIL